MFFISCNYLMVFYIHCARWTFCEMNNHFYCKLFPHLWTSVLKFLPCFNEKIFFLFWAAQNWNQTWQSIVDYFPKSFFIFSFFFFIFIPGKKSSSKTDCHLKANKQFITLFPLLFHHVYHIHRTKKPSFVAHA